MTHNCPLTGKPCPNEKILHVATLTDGNVEESHYCEGCYTQYLKQIKQEQYFPEPTTEKVQDTLEFLNQTQEKLAKKSQRKPCPQCGITVEEVGKGGRFGCDHCYVHFAPEIENAATRIHGATKHVGKIPKKWAEEKEKRLQAQEETKDIDHQIVNLKLKMAKAIEAENYEVAGVLKGKIEELQRKK